MDHQIQNTVELIPARPFKLYGVIGFAIIVIAEVLMFNDYRPVAMFFTPIVWTGYILFIDAWLYKLRGESLISDRRRELISMIPLSIGCWIIFESYNLLLNNWYYQNLPEHPLLRLFGFAWSFATIFPGIFLTAELLEESNVIGPCPVRPWRITRRLQAIYIAVGGICLIVPLFLHSPYLFPPVWAGFIFLLEPLNYRLGGISFLRDLESGRARRLWALLASGLICGILWEFWNYWTYTKWVYTVPY
ncbi:MAG: hypothetical protein HY709_09960, partial [Candidatus Latescibacteria bacterium]|nr:hypothetical protein [Candidatus Latescibacterota bacterium]